MTADLLQPMKEISDVRQVPGEGRRRWFFSHEQDLLVWFDDEGAPVAFQLAYGKSRDEHALRWKAGRGFRHHRVDDGESSAMANAAPMLSANGAFRGRAVLKAFLAASAGMPREIADFVAARLREHPEYVDGTTG
jgi:hypothetical protein